MWDVGGGANIYHISKVLKNTEWVGFDWADQFFEIGRPFILKENIRLKFVKGDFYELSKCFGERSFDLAFSIQTLSWLPRYEEALLEILRITTKWVFVTSLFTDYKVDAISKVYPYDGAPWKEPLPYYYNIYCYEKFHDFCLAHGAFSLFHRDFTMDIDLPEPKSGTMGTFTRRLEQGDRLQFSGPLHMPWRFIAIKMG